MAKREHGFVETAVLADLERLPDTLKDSGAAALALSLARQLDAPDITAAAAASVARELRFTLADLLSKAPPEEAKDELDEIRERRARRKGSA